MSELENLEKLFFELASENRLTIIQILSKETLKMQEIADRLEITATEVYRQLQRLGEVSLVKRQPDGTFTITPYGRLVLHLSTGYGFLSRHREYFLEHDIWGLPESFINRICELDQSTLLGTIMSVNKSVQIVLEAEEHAWGISERGDGSDHLDPLVNPRIEEGLPFKLLIPEAVLLQAQSLNPSQNIEIRGFKSCPVVVVLSEKAGMIFFRFTGGRLDYAGFYGEDPVFLNWLHELFLYYWEKGTVA